MSRFSQFVGFATAHLSKRHSLRDVVANLSAQGSKLYHLGVKAVTRSSFGTLPDAPKVGSTLVLAATASSGLAVTIREASLLVTFGAVVKEIRRSGSVVSTS